MNDKQKQDLNKRNVSERERECECGLWLVRQRAKKEGEEKVRQKREWMLRLATDKCCHGDDGGQFPLFVSQS
jgi:hypothetical protein